MNDGRRARRLQRLEVRLEGLLRFITGVEVEISIPTPRGELTGDEWADQVLRDIDRLTYRPPED